MCMLCVLMHVLSVTINALCIIVFSVLSCMCSVCSCMDYMVMVHTVVMCVLYVIMHAHTMFDHSFLCEHACSVC